MGFSQVVNGITTLSWKDSTARRVRLGYKRVSVNMGITGVEWWKLMNAEDRLILKAVFYNLTINVCSRSIAAFRRFLIKFYFLSKADTQLEY